MKDMLIFSEIIISILLIFIVLIQNKSAGLNLSTMSSSMWETTRRWPEKVLHNATIIIWTLFILNGIALFLI